MRRALVAAMLVVAGCSIDDAGPAPAETSTTVASSGSAPTSDPTTTTEPIELSVGLIRIGPAAYDLDFTCIAPGAGEILAVGLGTDVNGERVEAYVQAFLGDPFIAVAVGEGDDAVRFEPRLGPLLEFVVVDDVVRFDDVEFVSELDLDTGDFTPAGRGSVVVECRGYDDELPPSVFG